MSNSHPRVLFFGMEGGFSALVLKALLDQLYPICALVVPASALAAKNGPAIQRREAPPVRRMQLPVLSSDPSLLQLAYAHRIPVWEALRLSSADAISPLATYEPDLLCVACFSQRLPRPLLALPRLAALNVHPSLLPANRGPVPLFWTFREGHAVSGVTIHALETSLDSGDIFAQRRFPVPAGISYHQLEMLAARQGGELLAQTIAKIAQGNAVRVPQDETKSSYHSFPETEDFVVQAEQWRVYHVYNFIQGVGIWDGPVSVHSGDYVLTTVQAISYTTDLAAFPDTNTVHDRKGLAWVRCLDGWVQLQVNSGLK
ncbi:MAG TPA: formyltransferase family protein [Ktedonobacteraceae bacterium]|nr:formyltransferase family protein [Ktedonobacteraceae bacterium]